MLFWIAQQIVISLVVVVLIHSIYKFLQDNLTTPKIRDLVNRPSAQYDEIYKSIASSNKGEISSSSMKIELQNYLKELSGKKTPESIKTAPVSENVFRENFKGNDGAVAAYVPNSGNFQTI